MDLLSLEEAAAYSRGSFKALGQRSLKTLAHDAADVVFMVVGDSTGAAAGTWPFAVASSLATRYPKYTVQISTWDDATHSYPAATVVQTGTGTHTLTIWNCSVGGKYTDYHQAPYFDSMIASKQPDLIFLNHGHNHRNGSTVAPDWQLRDEIATLLSLIHIGCPLAEIVLIAQNPEVSPAAAGPVGQMPLLPKVLAQLASIGGYGFIDVYNAFIDASPGGVVTVAPDANALLEATGVHPNAAGYTLWANCVLAALTYQPGAQPRPQQRPSLAENIDDLLVNGDFSVFTAPTAPTGWTASGVTLSADTTHFENGATGRALRGQSAGAAPAYIEQTLSADALAKIKGKWVTFAIRQRLPSTGNVTKNVGKVRITDDLGNSESYNPAQGYDDFKWTQVSRRIDAAVTAVTVRIEFDIGSSGTADITVDRARLSIGVLPRDGAAKLTSSRNLADLTDASAARTNLGLGSAATHAHTEYDLAGSAAAAQATADAALPKSGGTMTGKIVLDGDPTASLHPATRQYVLAQIAALVNSAPGALDTLKEIADQLASDESAVTALTATVAGKLAAASNLSDLANAATARTNLGLGSAATHAAGDFETAGAAAAAQAASQPLDSDLTAIAALTTTSTGRSLLAAADAAALRTILALGTAATHAHSDYDLAGSADAILATYFRQATFQFNAYAAAMNASTQFYIGVNGNPSAAAVNGGGNRVQKHIIDPVGVAVSGKTTKLLMHIEGWFGDTAPGQDVRFDLFPVTGLTGTGTDTFGASVANKTFTAPAANAHIKDEVEIDIPADALYAVGIKSPAAWTANSIVSGNVTLAVRRI